MEILFEKFREEDKKFVFEFNDGVPYYLNDTYTDWVCEEDFEDCDDGDDWEKFYHGQSPDYYRYLYRLDDRVRVEFDMAYLSGFCIGWSYDWKPISQEEEDAICNYQAANLVQSFTINEVLANQ